MPGNRDITRDEPRVLSLIASAKLIPIPTRPPRRTPPCALAGSIIFEYCGVRFNECQELAAARADSKRSVSDLPDVAAWGSAETQVETWGLGSTGHRHFSNISAIARSETRNLPATSVTDKRPFLISVRSDRTVTCPPGKKSSTASCNVKWS